jgi:hypothetical protein
MVRLGEIRRTELVAPLMALVQLLSEYHWYEYGVVPLDGLAVKVIDWPLSIAGEAGVIAPTTRGELTVTLSPGEHLFAVAESVTL